MKKITTTMAMLAALTLISPDSSARENTAPKHKSGGTSFKTEAGDCTSPLAQFDMDINNVRARLLTGGDMWWNLSEAGYEVPKGDGTGAKLTALFTGAIWMTGLDAGNNLKCAGQTYRQGGDDYWPGPLSSSGTIDKATCNKYDRFFNVYGADIDKAQTNFLSKGSATTLADIPKAVLAWPAKGNQYLATDPSLIGETFNVTENLAPFKDVDGDGTYDPLKGDYPVIPCSTGESKAFADQMIFWVFNDAGNLHTETNGQAIGVQVNSLAFAFQTTDEINNMTFYKYEIINKSPNALFETYVSQWADPDLGCFSNDRVGCDTSRSLGIIYNNGTDNDCSGVAGYGTQLPLCGIDFFEGPISDSGQQLGLSSFVYFTNNGSPCCSDPGSAAQYRNYMTGFWKDGTPFTFGGTGYNTGAETNFIFPGNPIDPTAWSDHTSGQQAGDRRFVQTSGPFTLSPGVSQFVTVGVVFVRPAGGVGSPPNFATAIGPADDKAQNLFKTCFQLPDGPDAPTLSIREMDKKIIINLLNLPGSNNIGESYNQVDGGVASAVYQYLGGNGDSTYTFEGYKLYQIANPRVSATDLEDPEKAILIKQVDVKNGVTKIINFEKDAAMGLYVPVVKSDVVNEGTTTSFSIEEDYFATGTTRQLVNHKTYYYTAVAYAHNDYIHYEQSAPVAGAQLTPYLQGRGNFKIYSAIPHISDPRNTGTVMNSEWGEGVEVKRIEGAGNGGNSLQLTPATIATVLDPNRNFFADTLFYEEGKDPIGFKVTDPINLKEADFEMQFVEDSFFNVQVRIKTGAVQQLISFSDIKREWFNNWDTIAKIVGLPKGTVIDSFLGASYQRYAWKWFLKDMTNNVTIPSERYNDRPYEQPISVVNGNDRTDYGFSVKLGTPAPIYSIDGSYLVGPSGLGKTRDVYDLGESSLEYQNPTEQWLSFVQDEGITTPNNWIRSGSYAIGPGENGVANPGQYVYDDNYYYFGATNGYGNTNSPGFPFEYFDDPNEKFEHILNGTWAPYCLTANYSAKTPNAGDPPYVYGPAFRWRNYQANASSNIPPQNTLDRLSSVDIVITPDHTKWSRCIVFETGEDDGINEGAAFSSNGKAARKGQLRMARSVLKDGSGNLAQDQSAVPDTGRSWFPGYAVNVETGERLNICFGESSDMGDQNGRDMLWNPTSELYIPQQLGDVPYFGGKHFIYVMDTKYDGGDSAQAKLLRYYNVNVANISDSIRAIYRSLMWTSIPYLTPGYSFVNGYIPPAEVKIKLRVEKPFSRFATNASNGIDSLPRYQFSTKGLGANEGDKEIAKSALDIIRIVPNPYLAYSSYEPDQNSSRVKITNLPNKCTITIFALDGTLIRKLSRAIDIDPATNRKIDISDGNPVSDTNLDNSLDWDLKNDKSVPIASGIYLFHVDAPGLGQRTLKWFGAVRPSDTSNF